MFTHVQSARDNAGRTIHRLATATAISLLLGSFVLLSGCTTAPVYDQYAGAYTYDYPSYGFFAFGGFDDFDRHHDRFDHRRFDHDRFDHHHDFGGDHHWDHAHTGPSPWYYDGAGGHRR